jgi:purine-binding chemotaxis protein CheW
MSETAGGDREILALRARQLARPFSDSMQDAQATDGDLSAFLVVRIGAERFGLALDHITEVYRVDAITPIPGAHSPVVGVIAWRGRVLTVLDIAQKRSTPLTITSDSRILVIGVRRALFGIVTDEVEDTEHIYAQDISPADEVVTSRPEFVGGVSADAIVVLDAAAIMRTFAPRH